MAPQTPAADTTLAGERITFVGRLAMPKREAQQLVRRSGGVVLEKPDATANIIVVGEHELPLADKVLCEVLDESLKSAVERGDIQVMTETKLWQRLGFVEGEQSAHRLYTPAMLADLLGLPVAEVRRWQRRKLIVPTREVRRLAYFDFQEVATARRLAELVAAGVSLASIEKMLAAVARQLPDVERPLAQLSVVVEGKQLLLRQGEELVEPGGQLRFDFGAVTDEGPSAAQKLSVSQEILPLAMHRIDPDFPSTPEEILRCAGELEDAGQLAAAAEMYRASMAAAGPSPEVCFRLAEVLYQLGELGAARERYYMAIEIDEDYVEARANLGCVLAELGEPDLAVAAFEGALAYHGDYPDVHYHLAKLLDQLNRPDEAVEHWTTFIRLTPDSPWADEARDRLEVGPID